MARKISNFPASDRDSDWLNFIHFSGYYYKIMLMVEIKEKRGGGGGGVFVNKKYCGNMLEYF